MDALRGDRDARDGEFGTNGGCVRQVAVREGLPTVLLGLLLAASELPPRLARSNRACIGMSV